MDSILAEHHRNSDAYREHTEAHPLMGSGRDQNAGATNETVKIDAVWLNLSAGEKRGSAGVLLDLSREQPGGGMFCPVTVAVAERLLILLPPAVEAAKQAQIEYDATETEED